MKKVKTVSEEEWLEKLAPFDSWNRRLLMASLGLFGIPSTYLDIGSGTGAMPELARYMGIDAVGVDKIAKPPDVRHDLATPLLLGKKFQLVTCIEVAEHIPETYSGVFLNNVSSHMEIESVLIFSAAPPGQEGDGHIHLKNASYWRTMLHNRNVYYEEMLSWKLRMMWMLIPSPQMWLPANVQVFRKGEKTNE